MGATHAYGPRDVPVRRDTVMGIEARLHRPAHRRECLRIKTAFLPQAGAHRQRVETSAVEILDLFIGPGLASQIHQPASTMSESEFLATRGPQIEPIPPGEQGEIEPALQVKTAVMGRSAERQLLRLAAVGREL